MNIVITIILILLSLLAVGIIIGTIGQLHAISIMTFGDISCSNESTRTMAAVLQYLKSHKVDRFVFLGDAEYGESWNVCVQSFFKQLSNHTATRVVMGNHENDTVNEFMPPSFNKLVWNETVDSTLLIGMNTNEAWNETSEQYKQVVNILNTSIAEYKLVFMHKHFLDNCKPKHQDMCGFIDLYQPVFQRYQVDCAITGHYHMIAMLHKDGMCYTIYGMGGALPYAIRHSFFGMATEYKSIREHGFVVIDTKVDGMMHSFYTNSGNLIRKYFEGK